MNLENTLGITNQVELDKIEEKVSKHKSRQLFDTGDIDRVNVGVFEGLTFIHSYLFGDIYAFAGKIREVTIAKDNFKDNIKNYKESPVKWMVRAAISQTTQKPAGAIISTG